MMRLESKVAIVTGGASGMGAATATLFAAEGAKVVVADLLEDEGRRGAEGIGASGGTACFMRLDVTDEAAWAQVGEDTVARYGALDTLINNAGVSGSDPDLFSVSVWDQQMNINAKGVFLGMRAVIPVMRQAGKGSIVNISSISGFVGQTVVHMGYNAAKGAVRLATKAAAVATPQVRKVQVTVEEVHSEMGKQLETPVYKVAATSAIRNPYAGRHVEDLSPMFERGAAVGDLLATRAANPRGRP